MQKRSILALGFGLLGWCGFPVLLQAQVIPDRSLGNETSVVRSAVSVQGTIADLIEGGALRGSNLFHSFEELNTAVGQRVYFANPQGVNWIFSRVTGGNASDFQGTLGVDGAANLFLLNPNGILFGAGSRLDLQGAFTASTAEAIDFGLSDGGVWQFSSNGLTPPLLTLTLAPGLQPGRSGSVLNNQGTLELAPGQGLSFVADTIVHAGQIRSEGGVIRLVAGDRANLSGAIDTLGGVLGSQTLGNALILGENRGEVDIQAQVLQVNSPIATGRLSFSAPTIVLRDGAGINDNNIFYENYLKSLVQARQVTDFTFNATEGIRSEIIQSNAIDFSLLIDAIGDQGDSGDEEAIVLPNQDLSVNLTLRGDRDGDGVGNVLLEHSLSTAGGNLNLSGANILVLQPLSTTNFLARGLPSGSITLEAPQDIEAASLVTNAFYLLPNGLAVDGGDIGVRAGGNLVLHGEVNSASQTANSSTDLRNTTRSGRGGNVTLEAGGDLYVELLINTSSFAVGPNPQGGRGGDVQIRAGNHLTLNGAVLTATGVDSNNLLTPLQSSDAGAVSLTAGGSLTVGDIAASVLTGSLDNPLLAVAGVGANGGAVQIRAGDEISLGTVENYSLSVDQAGRGGGITIHSDRGSLLFDSLNNSSVVSLGAAQRGGDVIVSTPQGSILSRPVTDSDLETSTNVIASASTSIAGGTGTEGGLVNLTARDRISNFNIFTQGSVRSGDVTIQGLGDLSLEAVRIVTNQELTVNVPNFGLVTFDVRETGRSGNIRLTSTGALNLVDSITQSSSIGTEAAGEVSLTSPTRISLTGSLIGTNARGSGTIAGDAGNIRITAPDVILENSFLSSFTLGNGRAGLIEIRGDRLEILADSRINAATSRNGVAGDLNFFLSDSFLLDNSTILAQGSDLPVFSGPGGTIRILAPQVTLDHQASIALDSGGQGTGGNLLIQGDRLSLNQSSLSAETTIADAGNIQIDLSELLLLNNGSRISTQSAANGGNISLNAPIILGVPFTNNDIVANAVQGAGGNIEISTQALLGLTIENVNDPTADLRNNITASSQLGVSGSVTLNNALVDVSSGLVDLPSAVLDASDQVSSRCAAAEGDRFTVLGQGGVPESPFAPLHAPLIGAGTDSPLNQGGELDSRLQQVEALRLQGQYHRARQLIEPIALTLQDQPITEAAAQTLRTFGLLLSLTEDTARGQAILEESQRISRAVNLPLHTAATALESGNLAHRSQDNETALAHYQEAQKTIASVLAQNPRDPLAAELQVNVELNLLQLRIDQNRSTLALQQAEALKPIVAQFALDSASPTTLYTQLHWTESLRRLYQAGLWIDRQTLNDRLAPLIASDQPPSRAKAYAFLQWGRWQQDQGQVTEAIVAYQQSLLLAQQLQAPDIIATIAPELGTLYSQGGDHLGGTAEALRIYQLGYEALQTLRTDLAGINPELRFSFQDQVEPIYRDYIRLLVTIDPVPSQANLAQVLKVTEALQLAELDNYFGDTCLNVHPQNLADLDPDSMIIYPIILNDRLSTIISIPHQPLAYHETLIPRSILEKNIRNLYSSLYLGYPKDLHLSIAQYFYNLLLRPAENLLQSETPETLVFVWDGALRNIPPAVLHDGSQYLIERYNLAISPGLQLLPPSPSRQIDQIFAAALSEPRQNFSALPGVLTELEGIRQVLPVKALVNETFTPSAFSQAIAQNTFPVVHLATHAQFGKNVDDSFLLTWEGTIGLKDLDRVLQPSQLGLAEPIDLLVMSACQTAQGNNRAILGLAGFALRSGARSTLASLWSVDDQATANLMINFYRSLSAPLTSKAGALRQAQINLLNNPAYAHPYFWAPFVLVGNWQ